MPPNYQELVALVTDPNCEIEELDLSNQRITDGWIRQFLNVLKDDNHSVKRIDLRNNYLTNTGAFYISYILRADLDPPEMDLIELNLADNYITDETLLNEIESALARNQQLATTTILVTTSIPPDPRFLNSCDSTSVTNSNASQHACDISRYAFDTFRYSAYTYWHASNTPRHASDTPRYAAYTYWYSSRAN